MTEHEMYAQIADYMRYRYPKAIYRFDLAADLKLSIGQAAKHKRLQGRRGYPDLFIAEPRTIKKGSDKYYYAGLFLELKRPGTTIYKKNGELVSNEHIQEQARMLEELRRRDYMAEFACGFDETKKIIDEYLSGPVKEEVEF
jgi:hypothetical protein